MTVAKEDLQLFGGDWTERKLDALNQYLGAYAKALSKTSFRRIYMDAFAGTGYREHRAVSKLELVDIFAESEEDLIQAEPQQFLDGSARMALQVTPAFQQYVFVELDPERAAELVTLRQEFPVLAPHIRIECGEANVTIQKICREWDKSAARGVLFLDPFGMQVEWATIQAVAETNCIDVWILFPFAVNRLLTRYPQDIPAGWRKRLNALFGTVEWERRFYKERTLEDIFSGPETVVKKSLTLRGLGAYYMERLEDVFPVVAKNPAILYNTRNSPLFQLFFAAGNAGRGGDIALRIASHILTEI